MVIHRHYTGGRSFLEAISRLFLSSPQSLSEYQGHLLWLSRRRWPQTPGWKPEPWERSRSLCQPGGHRWPLLGQNLTHWNLGSPGESSRAGEWQKVGFQLQLSPHGFSYPWLRWPNPLWQNYWGRITYLSSLSIYFSYWSLHFFFLMHVIKTTKITKQMDIDKKKSLSTSNRSFHKSDLGWIMELKVI